MTIRILKSYTITCFQIAILLSSVIETGCTSHGSVVLQKKPLVCYASSSWKKSDIEPCKIVNRTIENQTVAVTTCLDNEAYCMVRNYTYTKQQNNIELFAVERNCSKDCQTECVSVGERNQYRLRMCTSCCQEPLCNYENGAGKTYLSTFYVIAVLITTQMPLKMTSIAYRMLQDRRVV